MAPQGALDLDSARILCEHELPISATPYFTVNRPQRRRSRHFSPGTTSRSECFDYGEAHNLEELGRQAVALDPAFRALADRAATMTDYAWQFRYPGEPGEPSRNEAEEALALAREVYDAILTRLPEEVRP